MGTKTKTYLIAHSDKSGQNVAQATVAGTDPVSARASFRELMPNREITGMGEKGKEEMR